MWLKNIAVENFRLLSNISLDLEEKTTVIVGRNNSGKTSLYEVLRRFLSDRGPAFQIEDFSTTCYDQFCDAKTALENGFDDAEVRSLTPAITLRLRFSYDPEVPGFGPLAPFIVDLDPACDEALIVLRYELKDGAINDLFSETPVHSESVESKSEFFRIMRERILSFYKVSIWAQDPNDEENRRFLEPSSLRKLLGTGFVNAQRGLDDPLSQERGVLGKVLESLFDAANTTTAADDDQQIAAALGDAVKDIQTQIDSNVTNQLDKLLPTLESFGYPGLDQSVLQTETTLEVTRLLTNFTRVQYAGYGGITLPESYNGLGVRNLIYILLQVVGFYKSFRAGDIAQGIHVIFIEEPEAHLHPQMQEVFIRQLENVAEQLIADQGDDGHWPVQFVVSTHSSHVANETSFECIRYFMTEPFGASTELRHAKVKDLRQGLSATSPEDKTFLHKYMTLTRCDLFFADKAILVEGMSERLMLPAMITKSEDENGELPKLSSQYVTILEVGGAYAHLFIDLLKFLELQTLIVTDLDSVKKSEGEKPRNKACLVHEGTTTSNACLKNWFDDDPCTLDGLLKKTDSDKTKSHIRLAFQYSEHETNACGRTFEDAFILANEELFELKETEREPLEENAREIAQNFKKSAFAMHHAFTENTWKTPRYIKDGLVWLAGTVEPAEPSNDAEINDA